VIDSKSHAMLVLVLEVVLGAEVAVSEVVVVVVVGGGGTAAARVEVGASDEFDAEARADVNGDDATGDAEMGLLLPLLLRLVESDDDEVEGDDEKRLLKREVVSDTRTVVVGIATAAAVAACVPVGGGGAGDGDGDENSANEMFRCRSTNWC
jgi:hypothetical protein